MERAPDDIPTMHPRDHDGGPIGHDMPTKASKCPPDERCPSCVGTMGQHEDLCILGRLDMTRSGLFIERAYRRGVQQALVLSFSYLSARLKDKQIEEMHIMNVLESLGELAGEMRFDEFTQYPLFLESLFTKMDLILAESPSDEKH